MCTTSRYQNYLSMNTFDPFLLHIVKCDNFTLNSRAIDNYLCNKKYV